MKLILLFLLCTSLHSFGQFTDDATRLCKLSYMMKHQHQVNCDSTEGVNLAIKICLNLEFQKADSILNDTYLKSLAVIELDSMKQVLISIQGNWVANRHSQAIIRSTGYRGHLLGIRYLNYMILATQNRTEELQSLLQD